MTGERDVLEIWTIYFDPIDAPGVFVMRRSTVLRGGDVLGSAARWAHGPGAVKNRNAHSARAAATTRVVNKAFVTDRARSLVQHLQGVGLGASFSEGNISERRAEVRVVESGGSLTVALYPDDSIYISDAAGTARALELMAAAVDDWETQA